MAIEKGFDKMEKSRDGCAEGNFKESFISLTGVQALIPVRFTSLPKKKLVLLRGTKFKFADIFARSRVDGSMSFRKKGENEVYYCSVVAINSYR